jgi:hypothetical protein
MFEAVAAEPSLNFDLDQKTKRQSARAGIVLRADAHLMGRNASS